METEPQGRDVSISSENKSCTRRVTSSNLGQAMFQLRRDTVFVAKIAYCLALKKARPTTGRGKDLDPNKMDDLDDYVVESMEAQEENVNGNAKDNDEVEQEVIENLKYGGLNLAPAGETKPKEFYEDERFFKWKPDFLEGVDLTKEKMTVFSLLHERDCLRAKLGERLGQDYEAFARSYEATLLKDRKEFRKFLASSAPQLPHVKLEFSDEALDLLAFSGHLLLFQIAKSIISHFLLRPKDVPFSEAIKALQGFVSFSPEAIKEADKELASTEGSGLT